MATGSRSQCVASSSRLVAFFILNKESVGATWAWMEYETARLCTWCTATSEGRNLGAALADALDGTGAAAYVLLASLTAQSVAVWSAPARE